MKIHSALFLATLAAATAVQAASTNAAEPGNAVPADKAAGVPVLTGPEASIPFINHGGIYNFHADNDLGIWIQARDRKWYYGKFFSPCIGIQHSLTVGFRSGPIDTLDRFGSVVSRETGRCTLTSLRASQPPPGLEPKKAEKKADAKP